MGRWRLRGCPRCGGDVHLERPGEWSCLQCGYEELDAGVVAKWEAREAAYRASTYGPNRAPRERMAASGSSRHALAGRTFQDISREIIAGNGRKEDGNATVSLE
jgi:hypothetical protein